MKAFLIKRCRLISLAILLVVPIVLAALLAWSQIDTASIQIEVLTPEGFRPVEFSIVPTISPVIRITIAPEIPMGSVQVLLDDGDETTPPQDITGLFGNLLTNRTDTAIVDVTIGNNTLTVIVVEGDNVTVKSATMLNFDNTVISVGPHEILPLVPDPNMGALVEQDTVIIVFRHGTWFVEMSTVLQKEQLVPVGFNFVTDTVRARITDGRLPMAVAQSLSLESLVVTASPNFAVQLPVKIGEQLPNRLSVSYRSNDASFDHDGPDNSNELRIFRHHFLMDTFAGHRLVDHLVGAAPAVRVAVADVDTGVGNGANTTDIPIDATGFYGFSRAPFTWDNAGNQIGAGVLGIADVGDTAAPGGHGTQVVEAAAGRGTLVLGTGKDLRVRPIRYTAGPAGGGTWVDVADGIVGACRDPNVVVVIMECWNPLLDFDGEPFTDTNGNGAWNFPEPFTDENGNWVYDGPDGVMSPPERARYVAAALLNQGDLQPAIDFCRNPFIDSNRDGIYQVGEPFADTDGNGLFDPDRDGKILAAPLGNDGEDLGANEMPSAFVPVGIRQPADPFVFGVSSAETTGTVPTVPPDLRTVRAPEGLADFSNFGSRVSVSAMGGDIILPNRAGNLASISGTSFSTPLAAGLAGEMIFLARNLGGIRDFAPLQIVEIMEATADDLGSSVIANNTDKPNDTPGNKRDNAFGHGRINVWKAILSVVNAGLARESHIIDATDFPSLSTITDADTLWYGFNIITSVKGATAWIDGNQLEDTGVNLPDPRVAPATPPVTTDDITAYKGVRSDQVILRGIDDDGDGILDEDPTSGIVPVGNIGGEYIMTFSIQRSDLIPDAEGNPKVLSLRKPNQDVDDPPYFNLKLELQKMRNGEIPGVVFDDFVFEVTAPDFGDATDLSILGLGGYPSALDNKGAHHLNSNLEWLGKSDSPQIESVSPEHDAVPEVEFDIEIGLIQRRTVDPDGVPNIRNVIQGTTIYEASPDLDRYDDGVVFYPLTYQPGGKGKVEFTVRVADVNSDRYDDEPDKSLYVNAWIDWNTNGQWEEVEHIINGCRIDASGNFPVRAYGPPTTWIGYKSFRADNPPYYVTYNAEFDIPEDIGNGELWARFRLDYGEDVGRNDPRPLFRSHASLSPVGPEVGLAYGAARFGEVEDYLIGSDFGDAPDSPYPTLKNNQGARHLDIYKEWLGETTRVPSVSREIDANDTETDQDRPIPNLYPENTDGFDDGVELPLVFRPGVPAEIKVTVRSTISSRGFECNGEDFKSLRDDCKPKWFQCPETRKVSKGKGRYAHFDNSKRLFLNVWIDWNGDGDWTPNERVCAPEPIDPVTFGKDGKYTLGEYFDDINKDGVWQPGEEFTDWAGVDSKVFTCEVIPPGPGEFTAEKFYLRARLDYGENVITNTAVIANVDEDGRNLDGPKGGALFGEVEDYPFGSKSGRKWEDRNGNGIWDYGESAISGGTIILRSELGEELARTPTDESGYYRFNGLSPGTYTVEQVPMPGYIHTHPSTGKYTFSINADQPTHTHNDFGDKPNVINGYLWEDRNGNGVRDPGELPLPGWLITLISGTYPGGSTAAFTTTNINGYYEFKGIAPGNYWVKEVLKIGWQQTYPGGVGIHQFIIAAGQGLTGKNFGNKTDLRSIITGGGGHFQLEGKGITVPIPGTGHFVVSLRNNTDVPLTCHYRIEWINQPVDVTYSTWTEPYLLPGEEKQEIMPVFQVGPNALAGTYQFRIIIIDQYGREYEVDPYLILVSAPITGYNTYWLIFTAISLMLAGWYLLFRQRRKFDQAKSSITKD